MFKRQTLTISILTPSQRIYYPPFPKYEDFQSASTISVAVISYKRITNPDNKSIGFEIRLNRNVIRRLNSRITNPIEQSHVFASPLCFLTFFP